MLGVVVGALLTGIIAIASLIVSQRGTSRRALLEARRERLFNAYMPVIELLALLEDYLRTYSEPNAQAAVSNKLQQEVRDGMAHVIASLQIEPAAQPLAPQFTKCIELWATFARQFAELETVRPQVASQDTSGLIKAQGELSAACQVFQETVREQLQALDDRILPPVRLLPYWLRRSQSKSIGTGADER